MFIVFETLTISIPIDDLVLKLGKSLLWFRYFAKLRDTKIFRLRFLSVWMSFETLKREELIIYEIIETERFLC